MGRESADTVKFPRVDPTQLTVFRDPQVQRRSGYICRVLQGLSVEQLSQLSRSQSERAAQETIGTIVLHFFRYGVAISGSNGRFRALLAPN